MYELPSELSSGGGGEVTPNPKASAGEAASDTDKAAMPPARAVFEARNAG